MASTVSRLSPLQAPGLRRWACSRLRYVYPMIRHKQPTVMILRHTEHRAQHATAWLVTELRPYLHFVDYDFALL
ncbi:jg17731 [Pararge aegeria aegeria]|uniref:Jg17731 protein n=1 Tax=Pararge aegeria aegeria TaxID=348720 RepID=A0A8S4SD08_9NEOP|nr:jg17731 [Pararge aegeria aegeria]